MKVYMDQIGDSMDEYELVEWFYKEGDYVEAGSVLCSVEVGKANVDVTSSTAGIIRNIGVEEEEQFPAGSLLCEIEEST